MSVITRAGLDRLRQFVRAGGIAIFVGKTPRLIVDKTFMNAKDVPDFGFATLVEPSGDVTARVLAALPKPDVKLDADFPRLTYTHKTWRDADMYFLFNESKTAESRTVALNGHGQVQSWDLATAEIHPISAATSDAGTVLSLTLAPYEAKVVVVGPLPARRRRTRTILRNGRQPHPTRWRLAAQPQRPATRHAPETLGRSEYRNLAGPATYSKQFTLGAMPSGKRATSKLPMSTTTPASC